MIIEFLVQKETYSIKVKNTNTKSNTKTPNSCDSIKKYRNHGACEAHSQSKKEGENDLHLEKLKHEIEEP